MTRRLVTICPQIQSGIQPWGQKITEPNLCLMPSFPVGKRSSLRYAVAVPTWKDKFCGIPKANFFPPAQRTHTVVLPINNGFVSTGCNLSKLENIMEFIKNLAVVFVVSMLLHAVCLAQEGHVEHPPIRILMIGDSTMASYANPPKDRPDLTGWGQVFSERFSEQVTIINRAISGRSTKSYITGGHWEKALKVKADYLFIQFGHNDSHLNEEKSTDAATDFRDYLRQYIDEARQAGMKPVLITPMTRRRFREDKIVTSLRPFAEAMLIVGKEKQVPVIDLHANSVNLHNKLGESKSSYFNPSAKDRTHFSRRGAAVISRLVAEELAAVVPAIKPYLKLSADTVLLGGKIVTMDTENRIVTAIAIQNGRILDLGDDEQIGRFIAEDTRVINLEGKTVIPGIIASHCHAVGVARNSLDQPYAELLSITEVQNWIESQAKKVPAGSWIKVPRADITRLKERRHPTTAELDAACPTHPVIFTAARKSALNTLGLKTIGVEKESDSDFKGKIIRDASGQVQLISGANALLRKLMPSPKYSVKQLRTALQNVHHHYNAVGITSIFERAGNIDDFQHYLTLRAEGKLTVRVTQTFRSSFRSAGDVTAYTKRLAMKTGDGDDWVRVGPIKITVDGGIHWGNTYLKQPYTEKQLRFYAHRDPNYRGDLNYSVPLMTELFREADRLGWQWCCHVTGDAGVDAILEAIEAVHAEHPEIAKHRFTLTHAYFPTTSSVARAKQLGICVDTQPSLYFKDSAAIAEIYGEDWAARFIGLGEWLRGSVPTAIAGDHMIGLNPDRSMNAYNPFLMMQVAVTRRNREGNIYGKNQQISRIEALRCLTTMPAWLSFNESNRGSLETEKLADLVILDQDILTCPENKIAETRAEKTMTDGQFVFSME